jgi:hypothetical protein
MQRTTIASTLMMEAERASETLNSSSILTRLVAREDFIAFSRRESLKSYKKQLRFRTFQNIKA